MNRKPKVVFPLEFFQEQGAIGGRIGGLKAAENMTAEEREQRARKAVAARTWRPVKRKPKKKKNRAKKP